MITMTPETLLAAAHKVRRAHAAYIQEADRQARNPHSGTSLAFDDVNNAREAAITELCALLESQPGPIKGSPRKAPA